MSAQAPPQPQPAAPPAHEPFSLPPFHAHIREQANELSARFAERSRELRLHGLEHDEIHPELWQGFTEQGWPGLLVPESHGGREGGLLGYAVVLEALAAANLLLWMPVLSTAIAHAIAVVGPDAARDRWLERVARGETHLALAVTEPEVGHNVFRSQTTVAREGDRFVVNGRKGVTSGIEMAERVLVLGRVPGEREQGAQPQFTTVLIDPCAPGVTREELPMRGREGVRQWQIELHNVEAPLEAIVGAEGQGLLTLWPFTHVERLLTAALSLGSARYCVARSVARAGERSIFGTRPIGAEQAIQHPLARLHSRIQATQLLVYRSAARFDAGVDQLALAGEANMAKMLASDLLFDAADHAMQTLGATAWDEREGMIDVFLDARLSRSGPVSQELALNFIAQHVLGLPSHR
jgi:alkylation response protein AidB-like acyl-CoA dehydrogenase